MRICDYDAIIIGAGVIGAATAYELSKRGMRTLCIDRNQSAGSGSTANSCAIVRFTYSTHAGVALAYEGLHYWLNWGEYLGAADENDLARYVQCGQLTLRDGGAHIEKVIPHLENVNVKFEYWTMDEVIERVPGLDPGIFGPPKRPDDEHFWQEAQGQLSGAIFCPEAGYVSDPQLATRNLQVAAEAHGASFMFRSEVVEITRDRGRVSAVRVRDGRAFTSPVVVNVAGPHSFRINEMAGVLDTMNIKTRALRHEVHHIRDRASMTSSNERRSSLTTIRASTCAEPPATTSSSAVRIRTVTRRSGSTPMTIVPRRHRPSGRPRS